MIYMLKISLQTGVYELQVFEIEGNLKDDLYALIDEYVQKNKKDFRTYNFEEIEHNDEYIAINGGEYYIEGIMYIEEVN